MNTTQADLLTLAETLATANGHLHAELARAKAENGRLRRSRANASLRADRRMIEGAATDAAFLGALHAAGLNTSRRAKDLHGLTRWRHEAALGILRLGRVYGEKDWLTVCPADIADGVERGRKAAVADAYRWRMRLPSYRAGRRKG